VTAESSAADEAEADGWTPLDPAIYPKELQLRLFYGALTSAAEELQTTRGQLALCKDAGEKAEIEAIKWSHNANEWQLESGRWEERSRVAEAALLPFRQLAAHF